MNLLEKRMNKPQKETFRININKQSCIFFGIFISIVLLLIYVPQIFIKDKSDDVMVDTKDVDFYEDLGIDSDNDGLINSEENTNNTNIWDIDSDNDGITDYDEINTTLTNPNKKDSIMEKFITEELKKINKTYKSPYKMNNVILWADTLEARVYGTVIKTIEGYSFKNFTGYVSIPDGKYVYKYKNGKHTLLKHKEKEDVWYVDEDCKVIIYNEKLENINQIGIFGIKTYVKTGAFSNALSIILPDKGFVFAKSLVKIDTEPQVNKGSSVNIKKPIYNSEDISRLQMCSNKTDDYTYVKYCIDNNLCVLVSLFSSEKGEYVGIVSGYTQSGDLIISDYVSASEVGTLEITPYAKKIYKDNNIIEYNYFDFKGLGFSSANGDRINFFATQTK